MSRAAPPIPAHALVRGTTWALFCTGCQREIAVDDSADFKARPGPSRGLAAEPAAIG
jgi:hypothetical protein